MNLLNIALSQVSNLIPAQTITIESTTSTIVNGIARPLATQPIQATAHIQPLNAKEVRMIEEGFATAQEFYKVWVLGDDSTLPLVLSALNQNRESFVVWNNKKFYVYAVQDWSLNGWIEATIVLRGKSNV